jgi:hypothetical protein
MDRRINDLIERLNAFLMHRPGTLPLAGLAFVLLNFVLRIFPGPGTWMVDVDLFLHVGVLVSVLGLLLVNVYRH